MCIGVRELIPTCSQDPFVHVFPLYCFQWNLFGSSTLAMSRVLTWWHLANFSAVPFLSSCLAFCPGRLIVKHFSGQNCFCSKMFLRKLHTRIYAISIQNYDLTTWARTWKTVFLSFSRGYFYTLKYGKYWQIYDGKLLRILRWKDDSDDLQWNWNQCPRNQWLLGSWKNGQSLLVFWEFKLNTWRAVQKKRSTSESDAVLMGRATGVEENIFYFSPGWARGFL